MKFCHAALIYLSLGLGGCDALLGGAPADEMTLDLPLEGLSGPQLKSFLLGDEAFGDLFIAERGLGPVFNAPSCDSCHGGDGKGHPQTNLTRFGRGDPLDEGGFDYLRELGGAQLQDRAIPGYLPDRLPEAVATSVRSGPVVAGLGLLEAIPEEALLALADPDDRDGDGVSGRPNYVPVPDFSVGAEGCACVGCKQTPAGCRRVGRFGRKATAIDLQQQIVTAYHEDMGLTTEQLPHDVYNPLVGPFSGDEVADPEVASSTVSNVVFYLRALRPPPRRERDEPTVRLGERRFLEIGCAACHTPELRTGPAALAPLRDQPVPLYADLLLHDLGAGLADSYPEGEASGSEWRTTPLWGLGLVPHLLGGQEFYLHDGRARSLPEAITLHGGEAARSVERYRSLSSGDQEALLRFLRSL